MTETDLEAFCTKLHEETSLRGGPLFDRLLHEVKIPQKRLRKCLARLGLDKSPPTAASAESTLFKSLPDTPYEEPEPKQLKQRVIQGIRPERPETADELREQFET